MKRPLKIIGFINPFIRVPFVTKVLPGLELNYMDTRFLIQSGEPISEGMEVEVKLGIDRRYYCITKEDAAKERNKNEDLVKKHEEDRRRRRNSTRLKAEAANVLIKLPVLWCAGIKDNLSGLSENSNGDGRKRNTVQHILLKEELRVGRLFRDKWNFLCGSLGKNWSNSPEEIWFDGDGKEYIPEITCRECLRIAEKIKQSQK